MTNHPITPPPELVQQWASRFYETTTAPGDWAIATATQAARWGADQELEACGAYLERCAQWEPEDIDELRAARRPKPLSLKERALKILEEEPEADDMKELIVFDVDQVSIIRRALEALPE